MEEAQRVPPAPPLPWERIAGRGPQNPTTLAPRPQTSSLQTESNVCLQPPSG